MAPRLHLIVNGEAEVWLEANGERTHVAALIRGSVFGETGMVNGELRGDIAGEILCIRVLFGLNS